MQNLFGILYFESTRRCNLNCPYCSTGSNQNNKVFADLSLDQIQRRILKPAIELGTRVVNFSGGEFLLRQDAMELLRISREMGFSLSMATNGILLDESKLDEILEAAGPDIVISFGINSFDADNPLTRETEWEFVMSKVELLQRYHVRTNISITMGQFNKATFAETARRIADMGLPFNRIPFVPRSCNRHELMPDRTAMRQFFHPVLLKHYQGSSSYTPCFLDPADYENLSMQSLDDFPVPVNPPTGCWVGAYYAINPEGDVSPCPMFLDQVKASNILRQDLKEILFESDLFIRMLKREELGGKCGPCRFNKTCGGCRVLAYFRTGDPFGEDPLCFIDELSSGELEEMVKETSKSFRNYLRMVYFGGLYQPPRDSH